MARVLTGAVLLPLVWALIKLASLEVFAAVTILVIVLACHECYKMFEADGARPFAWVGLAAGIAVAWSFAGLWPQFHAPLPLILLVIVTLLLAMWLRAEPAEMLRSALVTLFPVVFVALALGYLVGLRAMGRDGSDLLLLLFLCVILADTAAYYVGSRLGRHRMAPRLSPRKTWEGALGGLVASVAAALVAHAWFYQRLPLSHALVLGLALGLAALLGDLSESMVKRAVGVKDSSRVLPGHGGFLDRTDSLLFAGPLLYYYYRAFLHGSP